MGAQPGETEVAMKCLVVTADDFGFAEEINEAVEIAHRDGILSAASLMVSGPAAKSAVQRARGMPALGVGLHLVLVDGAPTLPAREIPKLVDRTGRLRSDLTRLGIDIAMNASLRRQIREEIFAQFEAFRQTGLSLDHVNTHKHFHLHPIVTREIIEAGRHFGMRALRIPYEPKSVLAGVENIRADAWVSFLRPLADLSRARARRDHIRTPDAVFGLRWSGAFSAQRMAALFRNLPAGLIEIYTHPAIADRFTGCTLGYRYSDELRALCSLDVLRSLRASGFRVCSYQDACRVEASFPKN